VEGHEDAIKQLKGLRQDDQDKLLRAANDRAQLVQQVHGLEERLKAAMIAADKAADEFHRQRYELQSSLTEAHRRCEDLQAATTRAEMTLQHERATGMNNGEAEDKLSSQLDSERAERLKLAGQLSQEQSLRQRADVAQAALQREVQVRTREAELASQRLQNTQLELQQARAELRGMREAAEEAKDVTRKAERERTLERDSERLREREREKEHRAAMARSSAAAPPLGTPPSLQRHLSQPPLQPQPQHPPAQPGLTQPNDELSRSDLWNFSAGTVGRKGSSGTGWVAPDARSLPRIKSPFNTAGGALSEGDARALYGNYSVPE